MGNCTGGHADPKSETANREIDRMVEADRKKLKNTVKVLLLGSGGSGKSTVAKQFRILQQGDYSEEERREYAPFIVDNLLNGLRILVEQAERFELEISKEKDVQEFAQYLKGLGDTLPESIDPSFVGRIRRLWDDPAIQAAFKRRREYQLNENIVYLMTHLERLAQTDYVPSQDDVIRCRVATTGVYETVFPLGQREVRLVDVGGQRSERRKWIRCFDDVSVVIFCAALTDYDAIMEEDNETNRMHDSLAIFEVICCKWFPQTTIVLFLNKIDVFSAQCEAGEVDLSVCFDDWKKGPVKDPDDGIDFIEAKFLDKDKNAQSRRKYSHVTCAVDPSNMATVFKAIEECIMQAALTAFGLM